MVGHVRSAALEDLLDFKEQLTVMLIGMLFVLLAADVRIAEVTALGPRALAVVAVLMLVVRPAGVVACTGGSGLSWREKTFLSWIAPWGDSEAASMEA